MEKNNRPLFKESRMAKDASISETLIRYASCWPVFLFSLCLTISAGLTYIFVYTPKFVATASILLKSYNNQYSQKNEIDNAISGTVSENLDNEMGKLHSSGVMQRVVSRMGINAEYFKSNNVNKVKTEESPISLEAIKISPETSSFELTVSEFDDTKFQLSSEPKEYTNDLEHHWDVDFTINGSVFRIKKNDSTVQDFPKEIIIRWRPIQETAEKILKNFSVVNADRKTTIVKLTLSYDHSKSAATIVEKVLEEYERMALEEQSQNSTTTVKFIDDRLTNVTRELRQVENSLASFQEKNKIVNVESQSNQYVRNSSDVSNNVAELRVQRSVLNLIENFFKGNQRDGVAPSALGIKDETLEGLISKFNNLQLEKRRLAGSVANNSLALQDIDNQLLTLKANILQVVSSLNQGVDLREKSWLAKDTQYNDFLTNLPERERKIEDLKRQKSISEGLYIYLLQKREEAIIIGSNSKVTNYQLIEPIAIDGKKGRPNVLIILAACTLLSIPIGISWIALKSMFTDTISEPAEVTARTNAPIIGEIMHLSKNDREGIAVLNKSAASEQFRMLRTNLFFLARGAPSKIILVTSTVPTEGKTFTAINLACALALPEKKVALIEFDFRRPSILKTLNLPNNTEGLTKYFMGELSEPRKVTLTINPTNKSAIHIYCAGKSIINANDFLLGTKVQDLFKSLRENYDYVVVDSPPCGVVSEAFILAQHCDLTVYVVRNQLTTKKQLSFIEARLQQKALGKVGIVINDVRLSQQLKYAYGYSGDAESKNDQDSGIGKIRKMLM